MAKRRPTAREMPDAVRDAVERTVQATIGSAQVGRGRAQEAVDELVRGAEAGAGAVRERVIGAFEAGRPATSEEVRELRSDLRTILSRLEAIERRLEAAAAAGTGPVPTAPSETAPDRGSAKAAEASRARRGGGARTRRAS